jgi:ubiquinone/menaquinone biosynthesis C-methylase UbiE
MADDVSGWFEQLYQGARAGEAEVPWARRAPRELLVEWARAHAVTGAGRRALVVGGGLGDDAEFLAGLGFDTVAFDVAPSAIAMARERFPQSAVEYVTADVFDPPPAWPDAFDLVFESLTVQSLPPRLHAAAAAAVARLVAPGGTLLVLSVVGEEGVDPDGPPWPLTRAEIDAFAVDGLAVVRLEQLPDAHGREFDWWRLELRRG